MKHTDIINSLDLEQKCALLSGGTVFTTRALPGKGIPAITLSDGPNGVRKQAGAADHLGLNPSVPATCFPTSATVANSWDPELGEAVGAAMGEEAAAQGVSVLLGPGLNIKRSPLCGRNFEYYSEDPLISGKVTAAITQGVQKHPGRGTTVKHYCCNSQETNRMRSNSILSERALRDIYLKGFQIAVEESQPHALMTSYNLVNGEHVSQRRDLIMTVLRQEWGFQGVVMTDWVIASLAGAMPGKHPAACAAGSIQAGNDIHMPGSPLDHQNLMDALNNPQAAYPITRKDLEECAQRVIDLVRKLMG